MFGFWKAEGEQRSDCAEDWVCRELCVQRRRTALRLCRGLGVQRNEDGEETSSTETVQRIGCAEKWVCKGDEQHSDCAEDWLRREKRVQRIGLDKKEGLDKKK